MQWRAELLAQAGAAAVGQGLTSFPEVMLGLLRAWPASAELDLENGGRVGPATRRCPPAEALLLRAWENQLGDFRDDFRPALTKLYVQGGDVGDDQLKRAVIKLADAPSETLVINPASR